MLSIIILYSYSQKLTNIWLNCKEISYDHAIVFASDYRRQCDWKCCFNICYGWSNYIFAPSNEAPHKDHPIPKPTHHPTPHTTTHHIPHSTAPYIT